jgi:hypothetical protein
MTMGTGLKCFNCGEHSYYNVTSGEGCERCGINCDYWGDGANAAMEAALEAKDRRDRGEDD